MGATIPIEGGTLAYEAANAGASIVFIAGLGGHGPLSEVVADEIAGARLYAFACGGHHFPQTQTEAYNAMLREFLRTHAMGDHRD